MEIIVPPTVGATIMFFAAFVATIAVATRRIPADWPFGPWHADDHPLAYRRFLIGVGLTGMLGALLLGYSLTA